MNLLLIATLFLKGRKNCAARSNNSRSIWHYSASFGNRTRDRQYLRQKGNYSFAFGGWEWIYRNRAAAAGQESRHEPSRHGKTKASTNTFLLMIRAFTYSNYFLFLQCKHTPLYLAIDKDHKLICELLLQAGAHCPSPAVTQVLCARSVECLTTLSRDKLYYVHILIFFRIRWWKHYFSFIQVKPLDFKYTLNRFLNF